MIGRTTAPPPEAEAAHPYSRVRIGYAPPKAGGALDFPALAQEARGSDGMAITGKLARTLRAGVVACLVLLGPAAGVVGFAKRG